ncbi:MAG TPA: tetratricopeptide repeat protein [Bacteroidia bacterium]|nr:tetratricopeptide repeat protein [Bacteroidia bacterium]HNT79201.1 tetratricopeptide repeat protein [Bacteroidia bacterium]
MNRLIKNVILCTAFLLLGTLVRAQDSEEIKELIIKAQIEYNNANFKEAAQYYSDVLSKNDVHKNALLQRGFCYAALSMYSEAIEDYTHLIKLEPEHVAAYVSRGSAYNKIEEFETAILDFEMAIKLDPKNQEAYNNRGFAYKGMGKLSDACNDWHTSRKLGNEEASIIIKNNRCK